MPDRVVSYTFRGKFDNLTGGLAAMGRSVDDAGKKLLALDKNGAQMRQGLDEIGRTAGSVGLVAAAGLGAAVLKAADFDQAMSNVRAATHETSDNMDLLRKAALDAGASTVFSATESAAANEELAKAGVSTRDILAGGLDGALDLAASDGLAVAEAAEIAASALTQFALSGDQASHVADLLAAGAGKAQGGVSQLGQALAQSGLVASQTGLSIEETVGALAEFASAGLIGSDAGTSFKTMLQALVPSSERAGKLMDNLGISAYDAAGNFVGMTEFAGQLQSSLSSLSVEQQNAALKTIFGSDAVRAASIIFRDGAEGVAEWQGKVNDAGYAADTAALRLDNLKGDVEQFSGALETALIGTGSGAQGPLRELTQGATEAVNVFNELPGPIQATTAGVLALTAVTGGGLFFGSLVVGRIAATNAALASLGLTARITGGSLAAAARAAGGFGLAIGGFVAASALLENNPTKSVDDFADALGSAGDEGKKARAEIDALFDLRNSAWSNLTASRASVNDLSDAFEALGANGLTQFGNFAHGVFGLFDTRADLATKAVQRADEALEKMFSRGEESKAGDAFEYLSDAAEKAGLSTVEITNLFPKYVGAVKDAEDALEKAGGATATLSDGTKVVGTEAEIAAAKVEDLVKQMRNQATAALSAFDAETQYRQALKAANDQAAKNNAGIKGNTEAALENRSQLSSLAAAWNGQSDAVKGNEKRFREARRAFIDTATAMGVPIAQARRLARTLLEIPPQLVIDNQQALNAIEAIRTKLAALKDKNINVSVSTLHQATNGGREEADGGPIYGPGTKTSDSIPAMLSNGEYVIRAAAVDRYGVGFFNAANQMRLAGGGSPTSTGLSTYIRNDLDLKLPRTLAQWERALEKSKDKIDAETKSRDDLMSARDSLAASARDAFRSDLFNLDRPDGWEWMSAEQRSAAATNPLDILRRDIANASSFKSVLSGLQKRGLDGQAFGALAGSGDLAQAQMFAAFSTAQLAEYERLFNKRSQITAGVGDFAGATVYGREIAESNDHLKVMIRQGAALERKVEAVEKAVRDHAAKGKASKRSTAASVRTGKKGV